jgi:hypothetical protein
MYKLSRLTEIVNLDSLLADIENSKSQIPFLVIALKLINLFNQQKISNKGQSGNGSEELVVQYIFEINDASITQELGEYILRLATDFMIIHGATSTSVIPLSTFSSFIDKYILRTGSVSQSPSLRPFPMCDMFFDVLYAFAISLSSYSPPHFNILLDLLATFCRLQKYRGSSLKEWNLVYSPEATSIGESISGRGLVNLGATCYINSTLQQFFLMPQFTEFIQSMIGLKTDSSLFKVW